MCPTYSASFFARGVYLCCILYHRDRVLVTYDDYPPVVEVDENFPSGSLALELHWLMKVMTVALLTLVCVNV